MLRLLLLRIDFSEQIVNPIFLSQPLNMRFHLLFVHEGVARRLPFGRQATAWEVAYATVWLLSGEASYVNAHPLVLDGGATGIA